MTTRFKRQVLIDVTKAAIAHKQAQLGEWEKRAKVEQAKHSRTWIEQQRPQVKQYRDRLTRALNKGGVIKADQLGKLDRLLYEPLSDWQLRGRVGHPPIDRATTERVIRAYTGVLQLLEATEGESLSINQLKTMGLTKIADLFQAAAEEGGIIEEKVI